ncbi:MEAB protein [Coccidioides immitis H538.4]|uniref:MEAB protein n=1 Tax=Coccidioides immitis H538.4 TaxID=396776 RepID=A0A0J8RML5_COCIT|nr:MEAB protein [Coccidioides immitis H538.4]
MGSLVDGDHALRDGIAATTTTVGEEVAPKAEPPHVEGSYSSAVSTPEPEGEVVVHQDPVQRQKRKGGRKPIYATSEERKQRNRQAQAAFRERRTEYIKQLEATIKLNEETLRTLQQSHRSAADECLMLRYKNSLLERILLEKGIDVQGELRLKSGSPSLPPARLPPHQPHRPSPLSQPMFNRQPTHQQSVGIAQRSAQVGVSQHEGAYNVHSSQTQQPTPSSHVSPSPAASVSSGYTLHGGMSPAGVEIHAQSQSHKSQFPRAPVLPQPGGFGQGAHVLTPTSIDTPDTNAGSQPGAPSGTPINTRMHSSYIGRSMAHKQCLTINKNPKSRRPHRTRLPMNSPRQEGHSEAVTRTAFTCGRYRRIGAATSFADHFDPMLIRIIAECSMHFQTPSAMLRACALAQGRVAPSPFPTFLPPRNNGFPGSTRTYGVAKVFELSSGP